VLANNEDLVVLVVPAGSRP
jgi:hypothetical protein